MLTQTQYSKLKGLGLHPNQVSQVVQAAGGYEQPKTLGGFANNVVKSGINAIGGIASSIAHPVRTVGALANTAVGTGQLLVPGEQGKEQYARNVGNFYKDRYGGLDKIGNTLYNDPVGAALDISTVVGGVGGLAKGAAGLATRGATSVNLASNAARLGRTGSTLTKASAVLDPFQLAGRGVTGAIGKGKAKLGGALANESENILTRGMGNPAMLKKAKGVSPGTMNELFSKYKTYDRTPESFQAGATTANKQARGLLEAAPTSIDTRTIIARFDKEIAKLSQEAKTSTKSRLAMEELTNRKQMFLDGIQGENSTPLFNDAAAVYDIKSDFQGDVPQPSFGMPTQEIGKNEGTTTAYRALLDEIEKEAPGIKNLGREQAALLKLKEMAVNQESRGAAKQNINFSRLGGAGIGSVVAGIPGAMAGYALEQIGNSPKFLGSTSKAMQLGAKGINSVKVPAKVTKSLSNIYKAGKGGRMVTPSETSATERPGSQLTGQGQDPTKTLGTKKSQYQKETSTYPSSITGGDVAKRAPTVTNEIKFNMPKNPFKNKSKFGKKFTLKAQN